MENSGLSSFHFNLPRVNEGIGEMTQAKNEMTDYVNSISENTRLIRKNSLFEYCTALDQMLKEFMVRAQGIAYGDTLVDVYNSDIYKNSASIKEKKSEYERVSSQYLLSDINFTSILAMLNNLKNAAIEINFSSNIQFFDSNISKINQGLLNERLTKMVSSANNVNNTLMSLKEGRIATQKARWDALTELSGRFVAADVSDNETKTATPSIVPIAPVIVPKEDTKEPETVIKKEEDNKDKEEKDTENTPKDDKKKEEETPTIITNPVDDKDDKENIPTIPINPEDNSSLKIPDKSFTGNNNKIPSNEMEMPEQTNNSNEKPTILEPENPEIEEPTIEETTEPITINAMPAVEQTKKTGINFGPVLAGIGATAAVGVGAKVYLDNKKNNENDDEYKDEEFTEEELYDDNINNEIDQSSDEISAETWEENDSNSFENNFEEDNMDLGEM